MIGMYMFLLNRYKIMLGFKLNDMFQNIIYFTGNGRDHCELVEGYELGAEVTSQSILGTYATGTWDFLKFYKSIYMYYL